GRESARRRCDSNRWALRSPLDRHGQFGIELTILPTESPATAQQVRELLGRRKNHEVHRRALGLCPECGLPPPSARNFLWRIEARLRGLRRRHPESLSADRAGRRKTLPGSRAKIRGRPC